MGSTHAVGAAAELSFAGMRFTDLNEQSHTWGWVNPAVGPRVALRVPIGAQHLSLRYDFRYAPQPWDASSWPFVNADWRPSYEHGLALGVGARR